jgi:hypothetical protein
MRQSTTAIAGAIIALAVVGSPAFADTVTATLHAQYFEVSDSAGDPDFGLYSTPIVANGSTLGPNGLPVASGGVDDIDATTGEITWWSPALNANVTATGTGTISLPYSSNMYAPNSTGTNDATDYELAIFTGSFTLSSAQSVEFELGSDDDSFIYVDGVLIGQNPGVHSVTNVDFSSSVLSAGTHSIEVFYADRDQTGASLSLDLLTSGVVITPGVPETSTWAMMGLGFAGLGLAGYRTSRRRAAARLA